MKVIAVFLVCLIACLATTTNVWEVITAPKSSTKSRFYVLHDWPVKDGLYADESTDSFPAKSVSDVMLKTLGILREGASWDGVQLGNLFRRPKATALFLVDGVSHDVHMTPLSDTAASFPVDQSDLPGNSAQNAQMMFSSDSVMEHIYNLFDMKSVSQFVSGNEQLSSMLSPSYNSLSSKKPSDHDVSRVAKENNFNADCQASVDFVSELLIIKSSVEKLPKDKTSDRIPDVLVFSFTTLKALQDKYGPNSAELQTAINLVQETTKEVSDKLVEVYNGDIIVQALVMQWTYEPLTKHQIEKIKMVFRENLISSKDIDTVLKGLPYLKLPPMDDYTRATLCDDLVYVLDAENVELYADCTMGRSMLRRAAPIDDYSVVDSDDVNMVHFNNPYGVVETRRDDYPALFLITFVTVVPLILALFAISWAMWNIDPGRDSIIYRNTDNIPGINN